MEKFNPLDTTIEELILSVGFYFMRGYSIDKVDSDVLDTMISLLLIELKDREVHVH